MRNRLAMSGRRRPSLCRRLVLLGVGDLPPLLLALPHRRRRGPHPVHGGARSLDAAPARPGLLALLVAGGEARLLALVGGMPVAGAGKLVRQVLLLDVAAELVRIPVADADAMVSHPPVAGAPEVIRHGQGAVPDDIVDGGEVRAPDRVAL